MKKIISTCSLLAIIWSSQAQQAGKITGSIKDGGNQKIIDAASISLLKASDSSLLKVSLTDANGQFSFENVKEGKYLVMASAIGQ